MRGSERSLPRSFSPLPSLPARPPKFPSRRLPRPCPSIFPLPSAPTLRSPSLSLSSALSSPFLSPPLFPFIPRHFHSLTAHSLLPASPFFTTLPPPRFHPPTDHPLLSSSCPFNLPPPLLTSPRPQTLPSLIPPPFPLFLYTLNNYFNLHLFVYRSIDRSGKIDRSGNYISP